jgi:purine-binding chemotaxis protein CheW
VSAAVEASGFELACFVVGGQTYGIEVHQVREIVRAQAVTPLPHAPRLIEGVIDLRGTILPVVDLGRALGGAPAGLGLAARIAVVEAESLAFGLRVDAAADVLAVAASEVVETPALVAESGYEAMRAVVRRSGAAPVLVLSLEHLLECVVRSGLEPPPAAHRDGGA